MNELKHTPLFNNNSQKEVRNSRIFGRYVEFFSQRSSDYSDILLASSWHSSHSLSHFSYFWDWGEQRECLHLESKLDRERDFHPFSAVSLRPCSIVPLLKLYRLIPQAELVTVPCDLMAFSFTPLQPLATLLLW